MAEPYMHFRRCEDIPSSKCPSCFRSSCEGSKARTGNKPTLYRADVLIPASKEPPHHHPTACTSEAMLLYWQHCPQRRWFLPQLPSG